MLKMNLVLGIDEAGRGCVIGPLVVCGTLIDESDESGLRKMNVKDSKMLSPSQRERIKPEIEKIAKWFHVAKIEPDKIDGKHQHGLNLNELETVKFAEIINRACNAHRIDKVIIDVPDVNINKFKTFLRTLLFNKDVAIIAEHYADKKYIACSAASIIAKVTRDADIEKLKEEYGDFGSGYPSDPQCVKWLNEWFERHCAFPPIVRHSWETIANIKNKKLQNTLKRFLKK